MFNNAYKGKRVLITGNTGFKGSWLSIWLLELGAEVAGYSLAPPTEPSHFHLAALDGLVRQYEGDVRDRVHLASAIDGFKPDMLFHLAAQALVHESYRDPTGTFETNALGTLNVMECLRGRPWIRAAVIVTSDKCYRNVGWVWGYRETDPLGGDDPYSGSKACAEIIVESYFRSYLNGHGLPAVASARAGNVIGGGDWAKDRLVPDCMRAWICGEKVNIRSPAAVRPWQHVLEPLSGYLWLGCRLLGGEEAVVGNAFNFGPEATVSAPVEHLIQRLAVNWPEARWSCAPSAEHTGREAQVLRLSPDKAQSVLGWSTTLCLEEAIDFTGEWYREYGRCRGRNLYGFSAGQIQEYCRRATARRATWNG